MAGSRWPAPGARTGRRTAAAAHIRPRRAGAVRSAGLVWLCGDRDEGGGMDRRRPADGDDRARPVHRDAVDALPGAQAGGAAGAGADGRVRRRRARRPRRRRRLAGPARLAGHGRDDRATARGTPRHGTAPSDQAEPRGAGTDRARFRGDQHVRARRDGRDHVNCI